MPKKAPIDFLVSNDYASKIITITIWSDEDIVYQDTKYCQSFANGYSSLLAEFQLVDRTVDWCQENRIFVRGLKPLRTELKQALKLMMLGSAIQS